MGLSAIVVVRHNFSADRLSVDLAFSRLTFAQRLVLMWRVLTKKGTKLDGPVVMCIGSENTQEMP